MELEEALKKITELETKVTTLTKENTDYKAGAVELDTKIKDSEATIAKMKEDARTQGMNFKKLRDYSESEKELLSEKEKEIMERQEAHEESMKKLADEQNSWKKTQRDALIDSIAMKKAGGNKEVADKIKVGLSKLANIENLATEAELAPEIDFAFNGLAIQTKPNPIVEANNWGGETQVKPTDDNFADTADGKSLAGALGLSQAQPENNK